MNNKYRSIVVWFIATLFVVYSFGLNTAAAVFSESIKQSLQASDVGVSLGTGAFILGFACMQIPAGYLLDKYNARYIVSAGILILAIGNVMIAFSSNLSLFSLCNFLQGVGASFAFVASAVLISQWFDSKSFPILFGLTQTLSCISAGVIHYYFTLALKIYSWNEIYIALAAYGFILFVLTVILVKSPNEYQFGNRISLLKSLSSVFANKQILLCAASAATSFGVLLAYASFWYVPVQQFYAVGDLQSAMVSGMIFIGIGIGTPFLGWLSNRAKSRVSIIHSSLVLGTMTLLLGLYLPHFALESLFITKTIAFLIGFFLSGSMLFYTMVSEISTDNTRGVAMSVVNTSVFLFNTLMLFVPYLFKTSISPHFYTYLWVLPFIILLSIFLVYFVKDTYKS